MPPNNPINGVLHDFDANGGKVSLELSLSLQGFSKPEAADEMLPSSQTPLQSQSVVNPPPPPCTNYISGPLPNPSGKDRPSTRGRRPRRQRIKPEAREAITPAYPWATTRRATVHNMNYLMSNGIRKIKGLIQCKGCEKEYEIEYDLLNKFTEIATFVVKNRCELHNRAPEVWMKPRAENCLVCGENQSVKPVFGKKRSINWLFLFLGQMIGFCKLSQLKYFCKHTSNHRTASKDRLVYRAYLGLCKQLDPTGPFDV